MAECVFCGIVAGEVPAEITYQDEHVLVFPDIAPSAPVHLLVVPKRHIASFEEQDDRELDAHVLAVARRIGAEHGGDKGYRVSVNSAKQAEVLHLHYHVLGGLEPADKPGKGGGTK